MAQPERIAVALYLRGKSPESPRITASVYRALSGFESDLVDTEIIDVDHAPWRITTDDVGEVPAVVIRRGAERYVLSGNDEVENVAAYFARLNPTKMPTAARIATDNLKTQLQLIERAVWTLVAIFDKRRLGDGALHEAATYLVGCLRKHSSGLGRSASAATTSARDLRPALSGLLGASTALAIVVDAKNEEIAIAAGYLARNLMRHCEEARRAALIEEAPSSTTIMPTDHLLPNPPGPGDTSQPKQNLGALTAKFTVGDVLATKKDHEIIAVKQSTTLASAADILARNGLEIVSVVDEKSRFSGVLTERDILGAFAREGAAAAVLTVGDVATRTVHACDHGRTLASVLRSMEKGGFRHMPIVEAGQIRGMIGAIDILDFLVARS